MLGRGPYSENRQPLSSQNATHASSEARQARTAAEKTELEVEKLRLVVEAMWRIMQEEHGYTDRQLMAKMAELDMADGKLDGRKKTSNLPAQCPKCHRKTAKSNPRCMYCGEVLIVNPFE